MCIRFDVSQVDSTQAQEHRMVRWSCEEFGYIQTHNLPQISMHISSEDMHGHINAHV